MIKRNSTIETVIVKRERERGRNERACVRDKENKR